MSDVQIFTGLAILIGGFVSLCPSTTQPNGIPAYHWHILVRLAWFSTITHQGTLFLMQKYFQERRWQRTVRLLLMYALLISLIIAMLPTVSFNWYTKRFSVYVDGPPDDKGLIPQEWLVTYSTFEKSAAQPGSPTLCYFDISSADDLYRSADSCRWGDLTPVKPPRLTANAAWLIRRVISYDRADLYENTGDVYRLSRLASDEAGVGNSSSAPLDVDSRLEQYCDLHTPFFKTASFHAALLGMAGMAMLSSMNTIRLFASSSGLVRRRIRNSISRYSRRVIEKTSKWATRTFPSTNHRPDLVEGSVTTPLLAVHLTGRLILDMFTSDLAKVGQLKRHTLFG